MTTKRRKAKKARRVCVWGEYRDFLYPIIKGPKGGRK